MIARNFIYSTPWVFRLLFWSFVASVVRRSWRIGDAVARSGLARLGAGVPKNETCRQIDRPDLAGLVAAANPVEQDVGGDPAHLVQIPGQSGDARRCIPGEIGVAD